MGFQAVPRHYQTRPPCHDWLVTISRSCSFAVSLLVGYYAMLCTGELVNLKASHVMREGHHEKIIIFLGLTKGGKRQGAAESCVVGYDMVVSFVKRWKSLASPTTGFASSPAK